MVNIQSLQIIRVLKQYALELEQSQAIEKMIPRQFD